MIGKHCGKPLVRLADNPAYFKKRCQVCGQTFKQRKRKATGDVWTEVALSDCPLGCKLYRNKRTNEHRVFHSNSYGCQRHPQSYYDPDQ